jgi:hypothetical protein
MSSRIKKSIPVSGKYQHREHRSKKGRKNNIKERSFNIERKKKLEKIIIKSLEENI